MFGSRTAGLAFARAGYGIVVPVSSGAREFVRDVCTYDPAVPRQLHVAAIMALAQPASLRDLPSRPPRTPSRAPLRDTKLLRRLPRSTFIPSLQPVATISFNANALSYDSIMQDEFGRVSAALGSGRRRHALSVCKRLGMCCAIRRSGHLSRGSSCAKAKAYVPLLSLPQPARPGVHDRAARASMERSRCLRGELQSWLSAPGSSASMQPEYLTAVHFELISLAGVDCGRLDLVFERGEQSVVLLIGQRSLTASAAGGKTAIWRIKRYRCASQAASTVAYGDEVTR